MVRVKICGITNPDDAQAAVDAGADALGFVFFKDSPRYIRPAEARGIISQLPPFVVAVGVVVNESAETITAIAAEAGLDCIQLHGDEPPILCRSYRRVIRAVRVTSLASLAPVAACRGLASAFLIDTFTPDSMGGTGLTFNWDIAVEARQYGPVILAGGLTPDNVAAAVRHVRPYGVDVSSGVEREKGKKDHDKMRLFIRRAKEA